MKSEPLKEGITKGNMKKTTGGLKADPPPPPKPSRDFERVDSSEIPESPKDRQEKVGFGRVGQIFFFAIVVVAVLSLSIFLWQKFIQFINCPCK